MRIVLATVLVMSAAGAAAADGVYVTEAVGGARLDSDRGQAGVPRLRLVMGVRLDDLAVEGWLGLASNDAFYIDCYGTECGAPPEPGLGEGGVTVRYIQQVRPWIGTYLRGDLAYASGHGALAGASGPGVGTGAGLQLQARIPMLAYLFPPLLLVRHVPGPRMTVAVYADASATWYRLHGVEPELTNRRARSESSDVALHSLMVGIAFGSDF